jgi:CRISPR-associated endonuclease Csn1
MNIGPTIWSFDLGKASIGEAVRETKTNEFLHKASLLIPAEFASTKDAATRRRMWRTRQAHKAREAWLDEVWRAAGLVPLIGRRVDDKPANKWHPVKETPEEREQRRLLEREFPKKGDATCYTSCLLRIKLLRGEKLEPWQIYKALHSAIQKRGYGRVPWAAREAKRSGKTEEEIEKELQKKDPEYRAAVEAWPCFKRSVAEAAFHFPCYYDAWKMGLWMPQKPEALEPRITCGAYSTRKVRFDRADVEKEIAVLARNAAMQLPALAQMFERVKRDGWTLRDEQTKRTKTFPVVASDIGAFLVHGPAGEPLGEAQDDFASYLAFRTERGIHPGSADDWMGATAQKTPRFDNRIINDCALISRLQVCNVSVRFDKKTERPYPDSLLASEVTFLMKLKNTLVSDGEKQRKLTPDELNKIFKVVSDEAMAVKPDEKNAEKKVIERYALTKSDWARTKGIKELELHPVTNHEEVKSPKSEGRSRFSRPALRLVRALILSGQKPSEFLRRLNEHENALLAEMGMDILNAPLPPRAKVNGKAEPQRRPYVLPDDLKFLTDLARTNDTWADLHFPEQRLDALEARHTDDGELALDAAIRELLGDINDPVVRHRLGVFSDRLTKFQFGCKDENIPPCGVPQEVVIEFLREDFMGEQAKRDLQKFINDREKARKEAKEKASELGVGEKSGQLKFELMKTQGGECVYCQQPFHETELSNYRIEHIVPRKQGGPDAMVNYVLAHETCNDAKGEMTPFQWKHGKEGWNAYETCVKRHATALRNKKVQLLLREDAPELVQRYTALAETAWISRLAQKIVSLHFGWRNGNDEDGNKRVIAISGGLTARIRRKYRLNSLLAPCPVGEDPLEWESKAEKNRADDRHHALDAMVINFLPQWTRHAQKEHFFRFPESVQKNPRGFFEKHIAGVMPHNIAYEKATLAETNFGDRKDNDQTVIVLRVPLLSLAYNVKNQKKVFDIDYLRKQIKDVREPIIADALGGFIADGHDTEEAWQSFCDTLRLPKRDGTPGPRVLRVNVYIGEPTEYCELSKDGTGTWRKGLGSHKGQIIYWDENGTLSVRPVFAHGSVAKERRAVEELGGKAKFYGFFQSDCAVRTTKEIPADKYKLVVKNEAKQKRRIVAEQPLSPCELTLRTIVTNNFIAELSLANNTRVVAALDVWVEAGLERV